VWSNLAWIGVVGRRDPLVRTLLHQDMGFSHGQLLGLLDVPHRLVATVLDRWRRLPSVSCAPYDHPILPRHISG